MRINDFYVFFSVLKRSIGIKWAREWHLSLLLSTFKAVKFFATNSISFITQLFNTERSVKNRNILKT